MNFQCSKPLVPLRVLIVNPLAPTAQLIAAKLLSGNVFGRDQRLKLILLVFANEVATAEAFKLELEKCAFSCTRSIEVSSVVPSISDADVFCFISSFSNPNCVDFENIETDEQFDNLYLIIKVAYNLKWSLLQSQNDEKEKNSKGKKKFVYEEKEKAVKPILMADGLVVLDILSSISEGLPHDFFFCPTPLSSIARNVLGDYLKVPCNVINDAYVWAANDEIFHVEIDKPMLKHDRVEWDTTRKDTLNRLSLDHTQFSASWMKKEYIDKIRSVATKNPYGCICQAATFSETLQRIWAARNGTKDMFNCTGVLSDGSLGTVKGLPYVLPITLCGETWTVTRRFESDTHLMHEIRNINKAVVRQHQKLMPYCKKFLEDNVINLSFVPIPEETPVLMSSESTSHVSSDSLVPRLSIT